MGLPFIKEAISQLFSKPSTEAYPAVPKEAPEHYRGRIVFHADKCIDCGMCERVCAAGAIAKHVEETEEGKVITRSFSMDSCTFCSNCADFCAKNAIELTRDYHIVSGNPEDFIVSGTFVKKAPVKPAAPPAAKAPVAPKPETAEEPCE
jgi:NADH-quinone oxidoreductase subunit I